MTAPRPLRVLIVARRAEDAEVLLRELRQGDFAPEGRRVETAGAMCAALAEGHWDAVLSDDTLPELRAAAALALLRGADPEVPFLVVSDTLCAEEAAALMRAGANDCVGKQSLVRLAPALARELRAAEDRRARRQAEQAAAHLAAFAQLEAERDRLLARLQLQFERMPIGCILTGPDLRLLDWNPAAERIFGYRREESLGKTCFELGIIPPAARAYVDDILRRLLAGDMTAHGVNENLTRDGRIIVCEWYNTPLGGVAGSAPPDAILSMVIDVSEQRRLEEQYRQAQKMEAIGQLAGGVAHDFNNLLTIITGYSDLLLQDLAPADPNRTLLEEIKRAGERSASLTRQLLAFSRKQVLAPRVLDLNALLTDLEKLLHRIIGEDVRLSVALDPNLDRIKADPGQLEQVLLNLAVNARDAMPQGGKLTLATRNVTLPEDHARTPAGARPGPHVLLSVSDTGCGMTPEVKARIFEPFFTTKGPGAGTGLGLAVVHGVVQQAGGHIEVDSQPGVGTTFRIYLPRAEESGSLGRSPHSLQTMPHGTETVLLVEDEGAVRVLTRHVLRACGYTVLEASDGHEAIAVAQEHRGAIHLLVSDVVMPGFGGRLLAEKLLPLHPEMRVLYLSGYTDDAVVRHGVQQEQVHFLQKPFAPVALAHKVREVLDRR